MAQQTPASITPSNDPLSKEEPDGMEGEARLLTALTEIPSISKAWCYPTAGGGVQVTVQRGQRNLPTNMQRTYLASFSLDDQLRPRGLSFPLELKEVQLLSLSPSGKRQLIVRSGGDSASALLEVWGGGRVLKELQVPKAVHGQVYNDGWFGVGAAWSPDETRIAYVAEAPPAVRTPEWGKPASASPQSKDKPAAKEKAGPKGWRGVGEWQEDWGELNTGKAAPALFVLDTAAWSVTQVSGIPEDVSAGQPVWAPSGDLLVFTAWHHSARNMPALPQRLGIVYCMNRPCSLYAVHAPPTAAANGHDTPNASRDSAASRGAGQDAGDQEAAAHHAEHAVCLTPSMLSAMSPTFSPDGARLVFLSHNAACETGVHCGTASLHAFAWNSGDGQAAAQAAATSMPETLVDVVHSVGNDRSHFPGLYATSLSPAPFVGDHDMLITTQWGSKLHVVKVDIQARTVQRVTPDDAGSWSYLSASQGVVLATCSAPNQPAQLMAASVPKGSSAASPDEPWQWQAVDLQQDAVPLEALAADALRDLEWEVVQVEPTTAPQDMSFETIVLRSVAHSGPRPTILAPHGGPHSAYPAAFFLPYAFLVALGYNILLVNFRGSTGQGEDSICSLPGKAGTNDVADCIAALHAGITAGYVDPKRVALVGGSHGGFLTGHLCGQHPDSFRCAVLRNPVCDLSVMIHVSDIPDWIYVETYGVQEGIKRMSAKPSGADLECFRAVSPIAYVQNVKAPMFFMLGAKDRRVPMIDAKQYVNALRALGPAGPEVRTIVFLEDWHGLDKPQTEFEQWINVAWWLKRHMG